jgi:excisionase family DNA binding protein
MVGLLTIRRAAELLHITERTAWRWVEKGKLPVRNIGGEGAAADWRIDPGELAAWFESRPLSAEARAAAIAKGACGVAHEEIDGSITLCDRHPAYPDVIFDDRGEECEL